MIRVAGGLELLVEAAQDSSNRANKPLLAAVTGALWKCANSDASVKTLDNLGAVPILVKLLDDENDGVLTNVAGALAECAKFPPNRDRIRASGGMPMLSMFLMFLHPSLRSSQPQAQCGLGTFTFTIEFLLWLLKVSSLCFLSLSRSW